MQPFGHALFGRHTEHDCRHDEAHGKKGQNHFPAEKLPVTITRKTVAGKTVAAIRREKFMHGVSIRSIKRAGISIPVLAQTVVDAGDVIEVES